MRKNIWRLSLVLAAVFCVGGFLTVHAFNGPNCAPPSNCSLLNADSNRNIGFGTTNATPSNGTFGYVFSIASSTQPGFSLNNTGGGHNYVWYSTNAGTLNLWDVTANSSRLSVDTIGNLNVVNNVSGGSLSGTMSTSTSAVSSGNIVSNAGEYFGKFTGGGNYAFPANLGVGTSSNLGLPSVLFVNGTSTFMNGSVGIGTTAPSAPLEIFKSVTGSGNYGVPAGGIAFTRYVNGNDFRGASIFNSYRSNSGDYEYLAFAVGTASTGTPYNSSNVKMVIDQGGNVGIGTTTPAIALHVVGTNAAANTGTSAPNGGLLVGGSGSSVILTAGVSGGGNYTWLQSRNLSSVGSEYLILQPTGGNVGIGTTTPSTALTVAGSNPRILAIANSGTNPEFNLRNVGDVSTLNWALYKNSSTNNLSFYQNGDKLTIQNSTGNVGIATTTPGYPLTVAGTIYSSTGGFRFPDNTVQTTAFAGGSQTINASYVSAGVFGSNSTKGNFEFQHFNSTNDVMYVDATNDRVGIGTTAPNTKLEIQGDSAATTVGTTPYFQITRPANGSNWAQVATLALGKYDSNVGNYPHTRLDFNLKDAQNSTLSGDTTIMTLQSNGNVGIGTTTPAAVLQVQGTGNNTDFRIGRTANANYFDIVAPGGASVISRFGINGTDMLGLSSAGGFSVGNAYASTDAGAGNMIISGNVGIGTTGPTFKLQVAGGTSAALFTTTDWALGSAGSGMAIGTGAATGNTTYTGFQGLTTGATAYGNIVLNPNGGNVGIGNTSPTTAKLVITPGAQPAIDAGSQKIINLGYPSLSTDAASLQYVSDAITNAGITGSSSTGAYILKSGDTMSGQLNMNGQNIAGVGKLYVTTIDPLYTIGGMTYATYGADTIGLKTEVDGKVALTNDKAQMTNDKYQYVIDFKNVAVGSDLWLFWQTINEGKDMKDVVVTLTPEFDGRAWYDLNPAQNQIIIYAEPSNLKISKSRNFEVSYHLSAPRYDASQFGNVSDGEYKGTVLPEK